MNDKQFASLLNRLGITNDQFLALFAIQQNGFPTSDSVEQELITKHSLDMDRAEGDLINALWQADVISDSEREWMRDN